MHAYLPAFHHYAGIDQPAVRDEGCVYRCASSRLPLPHSIPNLRNIDPSILNPRSSRIRGKLLVENGVSNFKFSPLDHPFEMDSPSILVTSSKIPIPISTTLSTSHEPAQWNCRIYRIHRSVFHTIPVHVSS